MKMMEGLATSSTAMVRRLRCSTLSPLMPGLPTMLLARPSSSTSSITWEHRQPPNLYRVACGALL